jgi:hypothetical protein
MSHSKILPMVDRIRTGTESRAELTFTNDLTNQDALDQNIAAHPMPTLRRSFAIRTPEHSDSPP